MDKLKFNPATPLYTGDCIAWRLDQLALVLDSLFNRGKPVVVFVHGRGKEPNKSLKGASFVEGKAVPKIELGYNVSVLMFNWDSAFRGVAFWDRGTPLSNVPAAAASLGAFLVALKAYRSSHSSRPAPALLVHSMGSIVVQHTVQRALWPAGEAIFRSVVLSQPDADDVGHSIWLDQLAHQESVYVTLNRDDKVLQRSTDERPQGRHALGLGTNEPLASAARYIDLTGMGPIGSEKEDDHEVFGKGAMNGQVYVCEFFEQVLRGTGVALDPGVNVDSIERGVTYRLKAKFDPKAPCLRQPALPN
jgi:hypothetical protein